MSEAFGPENIGTATITPTGPVVAAKMGTWKVRYVVGGFGIDDGGHIRVAHRQVSDWEMPQFDKPSDSGFTTVRSNTSATLEPHAFHKCAQAAVPAGAAGRRTRRSACARRLDRDHIRRKPAQVHPGCARSRSSSSDLNSESSSTRLGPTAMSRSPSNLGYPSLGGAQLRSR